jgi:methylmalonyl-CoA mutase cobalamin-binding domain/chain
MYSGVKGGVDMLETLSAGFVELKRDEVLDTVKARIERGDDALRILGDARRAMTAVGDQFQEGTLFLAEMILAAELFKEVVVILKPHLDRARPPEPLGRVVLATPKGDIHDLGKNILVTLLESQGFEVHDLGVDVDPSLVVERVREVKPNFVGFSALMTTTFASMKRTTEIFEKEGLRDAFKLMVGGGVTTPMLKEHIGADFQTTDATEGVAYCLETMEEKNRAQ